MVRFNTVLLWMGCGSILAAVVADGWTSLPSGVATVALLVLAGVFFGMFIWRQLREDEETGTVQSTSGREEVVPTVLCRPDEVLVDGACTMARAGGPALDVEGDGDERERAA